MTVWRLILREIGHRKLNFLLALLSVGVAVGCLIGAMVLLRAGEIRTAEILSQRQAEVKKAGAELQDAMRKIALGLGFNVLILPQDQDLNELHLEGTLSRTMPEEYVHRLAKSKIVTVNHLLPSVMKKLTWPEQNLSIILYGTRGEVPIMHADPKKPLLDAVPPGKMIIGDQVRRKLNLKVGDQVTLLGREFAILKAHAERGTVDDSTVWINLKEAQKLLGMENLVNAILALECHCVGDRIAAVRQEIGAILPGTQIIERGPPALARAEARNKAKETAESSLAREQANRAQLQQQRERFAAVLVPVVLAGCAVWIGFLAFGNVRQRSQEIGILRAIGYRSTQILAIFLGKALFIGLAGAALGYGAGLWVGIHWGDLAVNADAFRQLFDARLLGLAVVLAPLLSGLATWIPAILAARQDPAVVLQEE